jgi:hypothetical protein
MSRNSLLSLKPSAVKDKTAFETSNVSVSGSRDVRRNATTGREPREDAIESSTMRGSSREKSFGMITEDVLADATNLLDERPLSCILRRLFKKLMRAMKIMTNERTNNTMMSRLA